MALLSGCVNQITLEYHTDLPNMGIHTSQDHPIGMRMLDCNHLFI